MGFRLSSFGGVKRVVKRKRKKIVKRKRKKVVKRKRKRVVKRKKKTLQIQKKNSLQKVFVMLVSGKNFKNKCQGKDTVKEK